MRTRLFSVLIAVAVLMPLAGAKDAWAISAWARRYKADCSMCHSSLNELNGTGRAFLLRGHRLPDDNGVADGRLLPLDNYLSLTAKLRFEAQENTPSTLTPNPSTRFRIEALAIYAGGPLTPRIDFFTEQYLHDPINNVAGIGGGRSKLADLYATYRFGGASDTGLHFRLGQFTPYLIHLHHEGARLAISRPVMLQEAFGGFDARLRDRLTGAEFNYLQNGLLASVGIANNMGGTGTPNLPEGNNFKDQFGTLAYTFDGNGSMVGLYGHKGKFNNGVKFDRAALLGSYFAGNWNLLGGYAIGTDKDVIPVTGGTTDQNQRSWFAMGELGLGGSLAGYLRYDYLDRNTNAAADVVSGPTIGVSQGLGISGRIAAELTVRQRGVTGAPKATERIGLVEWQWMY